MASCSTGKIGFNAKRKIPKEQLQKDYTTFRQILEEGHPSLYWYTPKDSLNYFFDVTYRQIRDSMTEPQFRMLLSYMISKINCGHTTVRYSKNYSKYLDTVRMPQFPLSVKLWGDSAVVYANLHRKDSVLTRGTILKTINGNNVSFYRDSIFKFITMDGYGINHKYQTLSNRGSFSGWYRNIFGLKDRFSIGYLGNDGEERTIEIPVYDPRKDTTARLPLLDFNKPGRKERKRLSLSATRSIQIDTASSTAVLTLNTFTRGDGITTFIKRSFRELNRHNIKHLVVDVRGNGGGHVGVSNLLTRFIIDRPYKLADSLYAINKKSRYGKYIQNYFWSYLSMSFISRKRSDGRYHFGYFERHFFRPKKANHFKGNVYVIIGGNSFSATTLFAEAIKGQKNVLLVGEETGGGAYGNTAWLIPDVTLPFSGIRFRLPKFRMVFSKNVVKDGRGVMPDIPVAPSVRSIRNGIDPKMEKVIELIRVKNIPG